MTYAILAALGLFAFGMSWFVWVGSHLSIRLEQKNSKS